MDQTQCLSAAEDLGKERASISQQTERIFGRHRLYSLVKMSKRYHVAQNGSKQNIPGFESYVGRVAHSLMNPDNQ